MTIVLTMLLSIGLGLALARTLLEIALSLMARPIAFARRPEVSDSFSFLRAPVA